MNASTTFLFQLWWWIESSHSRFNAVSFPPTTRYVERAVTWMTSFLPHSIQKRQFVLRCGLGGGYFADDWVTRRAWKLRPSIAFTGGHLDTAS